MSTSSSPSFGFIIARHVNSHLTNLYWNQNVKLLNTFYPEHPIVIIDDNSNYDYVHATEKHTNVQVVQSEFPKRGELLPYYYLLKDKYFERAIIIHDSVFFHQRIPFEKLTEMSVVPLWHFTADTQNLRNTERIARSLNNSLPLIKRLDIPSIYSPTTVVLSPPTKEPSWVGCFGVQAYIQLSFLEELERKHSITQLIHTVKSRADRSCLERIMGCLFSMEFGNGKRPPSILGHIMTYSRWGYSYEEYANDVKRRNIRHPVVKVWTGR